MNKNTRARRRASRTKYMGSDGTISESPERNMRQRVYVNRTDGGKGQSITRHEPIDSKRPFRDKGHGYMHE